MSYEIVQHTADVRIEVRSSSVEQLFVEAVQALGEVVGVQADGALPSPRRAIEIEAVDRTALLIDLLNEALLHLHTQGEMFVDLSLDMLAGTTLRGSARLTPLTNLAEDVKAVTYHEANVREEAEGDWRTTLVLDV